MNPGLRMFAIENLVRAAYSLLEAHDNNNPDVSATAVENAFRALETIEPEFNWGSWRNCDDSHVAAIRVIDEFRRWNHGKR